MPTPNIPHVQTANTFDQWRIRTNSLINAANELRSTTYEKEAGLLYLSNTSLATALLVSGNATVADTLTVGTLLATRANIGTLTAANATISHNLTAGNVSITGKLSLPGVNDVAQSLSSAANTVRISVNNDSTISSSQLNFVNSSTVTISISPGSGISTGNADVQFTVIGGGGGGGGAQGPQGIAGAQGAPGAPGAPGGGGGGSGAQGPQGVQGATGAQGATGPSTAINATNDTSSNPLYPVLVATDGSNQVPKVSKTKLSFNANDGTLTATKFVGDGTGITGIVGTPGAQGPQGRQGVQGAPGGAGPQGVQGAPGSGGAAGAQGVQGAPGGAGPQGAPGGSGPQGAPGSAGAQGTAGPSNIINATNDTSTATLYPVLVGASGSNQTPKVSTSKLSYNANEGSLTATALRATNDITAFVSDDRLKDRLYNIDNALSTVETLNGFFFKFNDTAKNLGYDYDGRMVGVSAQEVQKVLPEVIAKAPISDNYLTVHYDKLVPLLIEAIKELKKELDDIKKRL